MNGEINKEEEKKPEVKTLEKKRKGYRTIDEIIFV